MAFGAIEFSQIGDQNQPSPSVWGDCPNTLLRDKSMGYFAHEEFMGNLEVASFADKAVFGSGVLDADCDTGVLAPLTGQVGGYAKFSTGATDNDAIALYGPTIGKIVRDSGNKLWAEISIQFAALGDEAMFFGLTTEANATRDVIADDPSNSAVAALTAATVVGFVTKQTASAIATIDAKYAKGAATPVVVLTDVTNATSIPAASRASLAATTDVKLGLRFDGRRHLTYYVNGYKVATVEVDETFDQSSNLCAVLNVKSGSASAKSFSSDWFRYAAQSRN